MNRYLRRCFRGLAVGDTCTGTVHAFRLDSRVLLDRGIIRLTEGERDYVFAWRGAAS